MALTGTFRTSQFDIPDVYCVPGLTMNLFSVGQIASKGCFAGFDSSACYVQDLRTGTLIGAGHRLVDLMDFMCLIIFIFHLEISHLQLLQLQHYVLLPLLFLSGIIV